MRFSVSPIFVLAALASQSLATVFVTNPISSSSFQGGKPFSIIWQNNAAPPADFGFATISLSVGSETLQEQVLQLAASVNVTNTTTLNVTVPPTAGANYDKYFIKFTSTTVQDPNNTAEPVEAFSALFALTGMSGQFNAAQQNAVAAANTNSSSPTASSPSTPNGSGSTGAQTKVPSGSPTTPSSTAASPAKTSTTPSQPANGAIFANVNFALFGALLLSGAGLLL
ncbi:hypothetical protein Clacol_008955 [Clathrus columnatus]|uniref:Yeast cell wall synthesis Kre9/Knh1-like N-terminal domain-containing protein n=1 Tax=Clathrus columnatus TaxID=1419009 RepID=A0AAV5AMG2_9AGAM|nr:hypothetical protein Clacol_008955 [Clathrus columnatus]